MRSSTPPAVVRVGGLALAGIVLVSTGLIYLGGGDTTKNTRIELASARRGTVVSEVSAAGNTMDADTRDLAFGATGTVEKIYGTVGRKVRKGQVLARIDDTIAKEDYTAAKASLAAAEEALDNLEQAQNAGSGGSGSGQGTPSNGAGTRPSVSPSCVPTGSGSPRPSVSGSPGASPSPTGSTPDDDAPAPPVGITIQPQSAVLAAAGKRTPSDEPSHPPTASPSHSPTASPPRTPTRYPTKSASRAPVAVVPPPASEPSASAEPSGTPTAKPSTSCGSPNGTQNGNQSGTPTQKPRGSTGQNGQSGRSGQTGQTGQGGQSGQGGQAVTTVAQAEAAISKAKTTLQKARDALAGVTIKAPATGTILTVSGTVGTQVNAGSVFLTLGNLDELQVKAMFSQTDVVRLKVGQRASVSLATRTGELYDGKVAHIDVIATSSDKLVQYGVTIAFDTRPKNLLLGQTATVHVTIDEAENAVYVPAQAVRTRADGVATVLVHTRGQSAQRTVEIGLRGDQYVEIRSGLYEGDQIQLPTSTTSGGFPDGTFPELRATATPGRP